jgi:hypothetical protein
VVIFSTAPKKFSAVNSPGMSTFLPSLLREVFDDDLVPTVLIVQPINVQMQTE